MASEDWNRIDSNYETLGEPVYCAFLDILGYRNKIDAYYAGTLNLVDRISRAMDPTNSISDIMDRSNEDRGGRQIRYLSDSIIITYPQNPGGLLNLLHDAGVVAAHMSMDELFIRGGIAAGLHFDGDVKGIPVLVSSALRKAHCLEQGAKTPRILVDPALAAELTSENSRYIIQEENDFVIHFLQRFTSGPDAGRLLAKEIADIAAYRERHRSDESVVLKMNYLIDYYAWTLGTLSDIDTAILKGFNDRGFRLFRAPMRPKTLA